MINRKSDLELVRAALKRSRVVALLGPRQSGKTTLARQFVPADSLNYFDLEDPQSLARLSEPNTELRPLRGLVVIDSLPKSARHGKATRSKKCSRPCAPTKRITGRHTRVPRSTWSCSSP